MEGVFKLVLFGAVSFCAEKSKPTKLISMTQTGPPRNGTALVVLAPLLQAECNLHQSGEMDLSSQVDLSARLKPSLLLLGPDSARQGAARSRRCATSSQGHGLLLLQ